MSKASRRLAFVAFVVAVLAAVWWVAGPFGTEDGDATSAQGRGDGPGAKGRLSLNGSEAAKAELFVWHKPRASITGRVADEADQPIAGAQVCAQTQDPDVPSDLRREPKCTTTAQDGHYQLGDLIPGRHQVHASAQQRIPASYRDGDSSQVTLFAGKERTGVDITLKGGGVLVRGVIKDIAGGVIAGAMVRQGGGYGWWGSGGAGFTRSDDAGKFELWVKPGTVRVRAKAEGYAEASRAGAAPTEILELYLTPESVVVGRVVWAEGGQPVPNVRVSLGGSWFGGGGAVAYTKDDGSFRLERLSPGRHKPEAISDEGWGQADESVHVGLSETSEPVEIRLHRAATVRGIVRASGKEGTTCDRGWVSLKREGSDESKSSQTDHDGTVELRGVFPGTYTVNASCSDYVSEEEYPNIEVGDALVPEQIWEVHAGVTITGVVRNAAGEPVAEASLSASMKGGDPRGQRTGDWKRTEADGTFALHGLLPGTYSLSARHEDYPRMATKDEVQVDIGSAGASDVEIVLAAGGSIAGTVTDARGDAVPGAYVRTRSKRWGNASATTLDDGSFEIEAVQAGEHRVVARLDETLRAPGTSDDAVQGERVVVKAGETAQVALQVEVRGGEISGRVIDETGGPVADAFIDSRRESDSAAAAAGSSRQGVRWGSWSKQPVLTDQDGGFTVANLTDGRYTVRAYRKGGGEGIVEHIEVGSSGIVVQLESTGSISGTVTVAGGSPPERFDLSARDKKQGIRRRESFFRTEGAWTLSKLPPGTYELSVSAREGDEMTEVPLKDAEQKTGAEIELRPRITVRGSVVDLETGTPVPGIRVSVSAKDNFRFSFGNGGAEKKFITDAEGKFEVENATSGEVVVMAMPRDWDDESYGWSRVRSTISPDRPVFDLPPVRIAKRRTGNDERGGDLGFKHKQAEPGADQYETPLIVGFIRPGGPAAATELAVGDQIVSVDGHDVTGKNKYLYSTLASVPEGTKVTLEIEGGKSVSITAAKPL